MPCSSLEFGQFYVEGVAPNQSHTPNFSGLLTLIMSWDLIKDYVYHKKWLHGMQYMMCDLCPPDIAQCGGGV